MSAKNVVEERLNILLKRTRIQETHPIIIILCRLSIKNDKQYIDLVFDSDWEEKVLEKG